MSISTAQFTNSVRQSFDSLDRWVRGNGWAGYDPYDILGTPLFLHLASRVNQDSLLIKAASRCAFAIEAHYPLIARWIAGVHPRINAKAMGLFARGYLNAYQTTGQERYRQMAVECLDWLANNPSVGYSGKCWGYPFNWQSVIRIPAGTPSAVVTSVVGDAFWSAYTILQESNYLAVCAEICNFFISDLNIDCVNEDRICFSYTPTDKFHVHNANLFVAEFLTRIGLELDRSDLTEFGKRAANYTISEQNDDGSIFYWGNVQNEYAPNHIDHYHSGFEIRALYGIWKSTAESKYYEALCRYYTFYLDNLLEERNGLIAPKMSPKSFYPVNIHSCAEALICNATLSSEFPEAREVLPQITLWVISHTQSPNGSFIYKEYAGRWRLKRQRIPYLRWGQAWMLLALSQVLCANAEKGDL